MLRRLFAHYIAEEVQPMLRLAIPLVLAELGWMTMAVVDTMMVGRQANSAEAIGAVSLGSILFMAVAIFGAGLMLGLDTLVSHSFGAGDVGDCHRSMVNGVYLSLGIAPVLMGVIRLMEPVLGSIGIQAAVLHQTIPYLRALNWGMLPLLFYSVFRRYLQGMNHVRPVMFALVTANLVNLVGNWALIYGHLGLPRLGTVGSGWSTCIARTYMMSVLLGYALYYDHRYQTGLRVAERRPNFFRLWRLVQLGFPAAMQFGMEVGVFGGDNFDWQARRGLAGEPSSGAQHRESHVYGAARNRFGGGCARGAFARAGRRARSEPRGMDGAGAGHRVHDRDGDSVSDCAAVHRARVHAGSGGDSRGEFAALCRRVFSVVRWDADGGDGSVARGGRHADRDGVPHIFLLVYRTAARRVAVLPAGMGRAGAVDRAVRRADIDRQRAADFLAAQRAVVRRTGGDARESARGDGATHVVGSLFAAHWA